MNEYSFFDLSNIKYNNEDTIKQCVVSLRSITYFFILYKKDRIDHIKAAIMQLTGSIESKISMVCNVAILDSAIVRIQSIISRNKNRRRL